MGKVTASRHCVLASPLFEVSEDGGTVDPGQSKGRTTTLFVAES